MRIKTKVEIQLNTDGTWEVLRFLSGPTKQVKLGTKTEEEEERKWRHGVWPEVFGEYKKPTPVKDALNRAERIRHQRKHNWNNTQRKVQRCRACGHRGVNIRTCNGDGTHRAAIENFIPLRYRNERRYKGVK